MIFHTQDMDEASLKLWALFFLRYGVPITPHITSWNKQGLNTQLHTDTCVKSNDIFPNVISPATDDPMIAALTFASRWSTLKFTIPKRNTRYPEKMIYIPIYSVRWASFEYWLVADIFENYWAYLMHLWHHALVFPKVLGEIHVSVWTATSKLYQIKTS